MKEEQVRQAPSILIKGVPEVRKYVSALSRYTSRWVVRSVALYTKKNYYNDISKPRSIRYNFFENATS